MATGKDADECSRRLVEAREAKSWLQKDLVEESGIDRSTVSKHENGTKIPWDKAVIYAEALGNVAPEDLAEAVSPSLLASVREIERLVRTLVPEIPVEAVPTRQELGRELASQKSKTARAERKAAGQ